MKSAKDILSGKGKVVLDKMRGNVCLFERGGLKGFHEKTPIVGEDFRFDKNNVGNRQSFKGKGHD
jgi:hypothetical protein